MTEPTDRLNELRIKVRDGIPITLEESREALELLRGQRKSTLDAQVKKEGKKAPVNLQDLFT